MECTALSKYLTLFIIIHHVSVLLLFRWLTLNDSVVHWSSIRPMGERLRLLLPPPGSITWLVLS